MRRLMVSACAATLMLGCEPSTGASTQPAPTASAVPEATPSAASPAPAEPAPPAEPTTEDLAGALVTTVETLGQLHQTHAEDCGALAGALREFHAEHAASLRDVPEGVHAWVDAHEPLRERMHGAMEHVMTGSMACRADEQFAAMQRSLFGEPAPAPAEPPR